MDSIEPGHEVLTIDGSRWGRVGEVEPQRFRLERGESSAWVTRSAIFHVDRGVVTLICGADGLHRYFVGQGISLDGPERWMVSGR